MDIEKRAIIYKFSKLKKECEFIETELLNYIEMLNNKGLNFTYSRCDFEDFLIWYNTQRALKESVNPYKCQEIINATFDFSIDKSNDFSLY